MGPASAILAAEMTLTTPETASHSVSLAGNTAVKRDLLPDQSMRR
jgi:hypothetical protein